MKKGVVNKSSRFSGLKLIRFSRTNKILFLLLFLLVVIAFIYLKLETNCANDEVCFNELATQCQKARVNLQREGNTFEYTVLGEKDDKCEVNIKILDLNQQYDAETKTLLEDKEMFCMIPKEKLSRLTETEAVIDYCSGPLKEALYELIIKRIYGALAENLGPTIKKVEPAL